MFKKFYFKICRPRDTSSLLVLQRLTKGPGTVLIKVLLYNPPSWRGRQMLERELLVWWSFSSLCSKKGRPLWRSCLFLLIQLLQFHFSGRISERMRCSGQNLWLTFIIEASFQNSFTEIKPRNRNHN